MDNANPVTSSAVQRGKSSDILTSSTDSLNGHEDSFDEEEARELVRNIDAPKTDNSAGDVLYEVYDSLERFTTERLILIAKKIDLDEEIVIKMLQANASLSRQTQKRIGDGKRRRRARLAESLAASGLL